MPETLPYARTFANLTIPAQGRAELIELVLGDVEFAVGHPQPSHERTQVKDSRLSHTRRHRDGRLAQDAKGRCGIDLADVVLLEEARHRGLAQARCFGRCWREIP